MRTIDANTITDAVLEQMASTPNPRFRQIMEALVRHLHDFAREVDLTPEEWLEGIRYLTATGQLCSASRQEFLLLSGALGLSSLINKLNQRRSPERGTEASILGPYYRRNPPAKALGDWLANNPGDAPAIAVFGRVSDAQGRAIANASVEIWQSDETGAYDLQKYDTSVMDLRGRFLTDADGRYYFRTVRPQHYLIPTDGTVGQLIRAQGRHGYRPAHLHFLISAPGHRELVTALFLSGDRYLESDTVFGVTGPLVVDIKENDPACPFPGMPSIHFDFQLVKASAAAAASGRIGADPADFGTR
jgi:hydroxyquinol 1,2-dioxygenase